MPSWINRNEQRRYPLRDDVTVSELDGVFGDLKLTLPESLAGTVELFSLSAGPTYISFVIRVGATDVAWYGGTKTPGQVLPLTPLVAGVSGLFVFGNQVTTYTGVVEDEGMVLSDQAYVFQVSTVTDTFDVTFPWGTSSMDGIIDLRAGENLQISLQTDVETSTGEILPQAIVIELADSVSDETIDAIAGNESRHTQAVNCLPGAIASINGVRPDINGDLTLRITGLLSLLVPEAGVVQFVSDLESTRACANQITLEDYTPAVELIDTEGP